MDKVRLGIIGCGGIMQGFHAKHLVEFDDIEVVAVADPIEERRDAVMLKQLEISLAHNQEMIGNTYDVLIDEIDDEGAYVGRTRYDAPDIDNSVIFTSEKEHKPGDIVKVMIEEAYDYDLQGREVCDESAE